MEHRELAKAIMVNIDNRLAQSSIQTEWQRNRYLDQCSAIIEEIEISMNAAKETSFE